MSEAAKSAALIVIAAAALAAVAFKDPIRLETTKCVSEPQVIRFMPIPEPISLIPTPGWSWPMDQRLDRFETDEPAPAPQISAEAIKPVIVKTRYRYMRPRRYWR